MPEQPGLEKLKGFQIEEPTGLPDLPGLPDPDSPEFQSGELGAGIRIARAISLLLAGASDPNLAAALAQQFQRQDLVAREDAQNRYKIALGTAQAEREEVGFQEDARKTRTIEQRDVAEIQLRAALGALEAAKFEHELTQDKDKREQLAITIPQLMAIAQSRTPEVPQVTPAKSVFELIKRGVDPEKVSQALVKGTGEQLLNEYNANLPTPPMPKPLFSQQEIEAIKASTTPEGRVVVDLMMATVPDPRTDVFGSPADSLTYNSAARRLAQIDPEAHDKIVMTTTQAWVAAGRVQDLEKAETIIADSEHTNSDPEDDPRLMPPGTFQQAPSIFERLKAKLPETRRQKRERAVKEANKELERQGKPEGRF